MKLRTIAIVAALATTITLGTTSVALASAPTATHGNASASTRVAYSDAQVVEFLGTGQGPLAKKFPALLEYVPQTETGITPAEVNKLVARYERVDPKFHATVTVPLQSGNPYTTLAAINKLEKDSDALSAGTTAVAPNVAVGDCATVLAVALALWVVLALFLWVPAAVPVGTNNTLTNESFAAQIAAGFRS